jgi:AraC-like DNA-binding protein
VVTRILNDLPFEPFEISHLVDSKGRYRLELDPSFPFSIKLFSYDGITPPFPLNWHERLEIFVPLSGRGSFQIGSRQVPFRRNDVLVVDTLKMHGLADFQGKQSRAAVISFLPELIYTLGSPLCDFVFLTPFYCQTETGDPVLRATDRLAMAIRCSLLKLFSCYFTSSEGPFLQAGCKVYLQDVLYILAKHFGWSEAVRAEYLRRQENSELLCRLHRYLDLRYTEKIRVADAAAVAGMSESQFMKFFRRSTGMTFVRYLTQKRLNHAHRLMAETNLTVAEIATQAGFCDQSYFDKKFRQFFRETPRSFRIRCRQAGVEREEMPTMAGSRTPARDFSG